MRLFGFRKVMIQQAAYAPLSPALPRAVGFLRDLWEGGLAGCREERSIGRGPAQSPDGSRSAGCGGFDPLVLLGGPGRGALARLTTVSPVPIGTVSKG
jgi:hypothetical protein